MFVFLWYLYLFCATGRLLWWLLFRIGITKKNKASITSPHTDPVGISIVVCAHNNIGGLQKLIPLLLQQNYPLFEIIVVNDRSNDDTAPWLNTQARIHPLLNIITIQETPEGWNGKKYALQQGIKHAQYPLLALTDSDCMPLSPQWLKYITQAFQDPHTDIFLGYSPYQYQKGILNGLIRTETLFTAFQYLSLANLHMTYMGVGRNLGYRKRFLEKHLDHFPFQSHIGGDDDLLINSLSSGKDASIGLNTESFVVSEPVFTWKAWWRQKRRHLSAGQKYKFSTQCLLASYWVSALGFWLLFFILCLCNPYNGTIFVVQALVFVLGIWIINPIFLIFQEGRLRILFPFWDFLYIAGSSVIGLSTFGVKNKRWS